MKASAPDETVHQTVRKEAADWYARLRGATLTELEAARFQAWLAGPPAHRQEFERLGELWAQLEGLARSPEILGIRREVAAEPPKDVGSRVSRRAVLGWSMAAGVAGAAALLGSQYIAVSETYATGIGELRSVTLRDGSTVMLNTASEVRVRFSGRKREIELASGQAHFEVAKDASRPFIVRAGAGEVVAVGTVFDVYQRANDIVVTLIEGRVDVTADQARLVLTPGEQVTYGAPGRAPVREAADLRRVSAWRSRKLEFRETPLAEAIAEANRYSRVRIELRDAGLADARISGVFDAGRNDSLASALRAYFGLTMERVGEDRILLTSGSR